MIVNCKKISIVILFLALLAVLSGCTPQMTPSSPGDREAADSNVLRVGLTPNYPPIIYSENNRLAGLEIDYAYALAAELGRDVKFVPMKFEDLIPAMQRQEIDIIMSGMSITKLRSVRVAFSKPYMVVGQMVLVRTEDRVKYGVPLMVVSSTDKIGVSKGTTGDIFVQNNCKNAKKITYQLPANGVSDLRKGTIDMLILDAPQIWLMAAENEAKGLSMLPFKLTKEYLAWAVNKGDQELLQKINITLEKWNKNGKMLAVNKKWLPFSGT